MAQSATDQPIAELEATAEQIQGMVEDLFQTMLECEITPINDRSVAPEPGSLMATVRIEGSVNCEISTITSLRLAEDIACAMFDTDLDNVTGDEAKDAIGEVANIVGGNIKGLVDTPCELTIPTVTAAPDIPHDAQCEVFRCSDSLFHVVVIHK